MGTDFRKIKHVIIDFLEKESNGPVSETNEEWNRETLPWQRSFTQRSRHLVLPFFSFFVFCVLDVPFSTSTPSFRVYHEHVPEFSFLLPRYSRCVQKWTGCWLPSVRRLIYAAYFRLRHPGPTRVPPTLHLFVRVERPRSATTPLWDTRLSSPRLSKTSLSLGNSFVFFFVRGIPTVHAFLYRFHRYADIRRPFI